MNPVRVHLVAAARPNFMKVAPLYHALRGDRAFEVRLVHTGQHYDANMSDSFFTDLGLPAADFHLGVGSGTHAEQTGGTMIEYEKVCLSDQPDWVIVVGDVNATAAIALVCTKLHVPVVHLEAGLRSRDRTMPEEINRLVTDAIADLLDHEAVYASRFSGQRFDCGDKLGYIRATLAVAKRDPEILAALQGEALI